MNGAAGIGLAALVVLGAAAGEAATYLGQPQRLGEGTVRTYAEIGAGGAPQAIGFLIDESAFRGLPPLRNMTSRCFDLNGNGKIDDSSECEGDLEVRLAMPDALSQRSDVPFRWVGLNWNAEGHPPEAWSVPHFDFHFYIASRNQLALIRVGPCKFFINCDDLKRATIAVPAKYVAADHVNVDAAVSMMGNHLIDARTPELGDPPSKFTHTWIFGAYDGHITFYQLRADDHAGVLHEPARGLRADPPAGGAREGRLLPDRVLHPLSPGAEGLHGLDRRPRQAPGRLRRGRRLRRDAPIG